MGPKLSIKSVVTLHACVNLCAVYSPAVILLPQHFTSAPTIPTQGNITSSEQVTLPQILQTGALVFILMSLPLYTCHLSQMGDMGIIFSFIFLCFNFFLNCKWSVMLK